jgi:two-component system sensor histidine kinase GlrK
METSMLINLLRPISLPKLILFGFVLAVLPLVIALGSALLAVEELAAFSQDTAYRVAQMSRKNEMLREKLVDFERQGKRHLVLDDEESRRAFDAVHREFGAVAAELAGLVRGPTLAAQLRSLADEGETLFQRLSAKPPAPARADGGERRRNSSAGGAERLNRLAQGRIDKADELFAALGAKAREVTKRVSRMLDGEVEDLERRSQAVQREMLVESSVLLPVSVTLISLLTVLIVRSVRQMDRAIRRLGAGDFIRPIQVRGPKDLEYLGERLDWLRNRLRSLEEANQRFMRHVSHELKTPLATIHEGTGLLADEVVGELNTEQREIAQILLSNTQKLDTLIAELINYSQVNARPGAQGRERIVMGHLLRAVIDDCQIRLRAKSITVRDLLRDVEIDGNPEQLRTIVDNLLSNAIKYSPQGGEIRLSLRPSSGHMELEIEDDGPGIPPEERKQVFEPFFQGKAAKEGGVGGTGLGLAIVGECVAAHHGQVEALEPRPDKPGARIRVRIPLRQD